VAGVLAGVDITSLAGLFLWRWRRPRLDVARITPPTSAKVMRAALPLTPTRHAPQIPAAPGRDIPGGLHLHFHGVSAEEVAEILRRQLP